MPDHLFVKQSLNGILRHQADLARSHIAASPDQAFSQADLASLRAELRKRFRVNPIRLDKAKTTMSRDSTQVDVRHDPTRMILDTSRPCLVPGIKVTVTTPFSGDAALFEWRPSSWRSVFPRAQVRSNPDGDGGHVDIVIEMPADQPPEAIKQALEREQENLDFYLKAQLQQIESQAPQIEGAIEAALEQRRAAQIKHQNLSTLLGIPEASAKPHVAAIAPAPGAAAPASRIAGAAAPVRAWDAFVSHAYEDKNDVARPLAEALRRLGLRIWYDEFTLRVGDSLRQSIDHGLAQSRYGIVILSEAFFAKNWPKRELDGLFARESDGRKVILPVWHQLTAPRIAELSPMMADRIAVATAEGIDNVVARLLQVIRPS